MSRAFIGNYAAPSPSSALLSTRIAAVRNRTRPCNHDNSWATPERAFERDFHIAEHFDRATHNFDQEPLHQAGNAVIGCARNSRTGASNLSRRNIGCDTSFMDGASQRLLRTGLSYAQHVAAGA